MSKTQNVLACLLGISLSVSTVQSLSFKFPFFSNNQQTQAVKNSLKHAVGTAAKNLTSKVGLLHSDFEEIVSLLAGQDYFFSEKMAIQLPGINKMLEIDWGFVGSGDMYKPLQGASVTLNSDSTKLGSSGNVLFDLGKIVAQQEVGKFLKNKDFLKDLTLTPMQVFSIKFLLLIKRAVESNNMTLMYEELARLLVRLSMANNGKLFTDGQPLSSHIPDIIKDKINTSHANLLKMVDEGWKLLTSSVSQLDNVSASITPTVSGVVFGDSSVAAQCLQAINNHPEVDVAQAIVNVAQDNGFEQAPSYQKFTELTDSNSIAYKKLFSTISLADASNTELVKTLFTDDVQQKVACDSDLVISCVDKKGRTWILYVSDQISISQSVKLVLANCMKFFKEYALIKNELIQGTDGESQKLRDSWKKTIRNRNDIKSFVVSQEGKASHVRLQKNITYISQGGLENDICLAQLKNQYSELVIQKSELERELAREQKRLNLLSPLAAYDIQDLLDEQNGVCKKLSVELASVSAQVAVIKSQLDSSAKNVQVERQKDIEKLLMELIQDFSITSGDGAVLQKKIALLQQELASLKDEQVSLTIDQILQRRQAIAKIYEKEAMQMEQDLAQRIAAFQQGNDTQRVAQELCFSRTARVWKMYVDHLQATAKTMRSENQKAQQLIVYRTVLNDIDPNVIDLHKRNEILQLERQVGHILDQDFLSSLLTQVMNDDVRDIFEDLNSDIPAFKDLKARCISCFLSVIQRCSLTNKNHTIYRYLLQHFQPALLPFFDEAINKQKQTKKYNENDQHGLVLA